MTRTVLKSTAGMPKKKAKKRKIAKIDLDGANPSQFIPNRSDRGAPRGHGRSSFARAWLLEHVSAVHIGLLVLMTAICYGHTLDVPFYLDDFSSIKENPIIYLWDGTLRSIMAHEPFRWITYLSFAWNFRLHQFGVAGYHIVNICVHMFNGILVYILLRSLQQTPMMQPVFKKPDDRHDPTIAIGNDWVHSQKVVSSNWTPFFVAALFVVHPLHIQAVTYIVQRAASLGAFFYLLCMAAYVRGRNESYRHYKIGWFGICFSAMLCAFFTKQNTVTLPAALILLEVLFWETSRKKIFIILSVFCVGLFTIWILFAGILHLNPFSIESMAVMGRETATISRHAYFWTQLVVLWFYIGLFFYPSGLCIDYKGYPVYDMMWQTAVFYSLIGHIVCWVLIGWLIRRNRFMAFGLMFYYLAHLVESSIIPISDVVFEHRTYLPNVGMCCFVGYSAQSFFSWKRIPMVKTVLGIGSLCILMVASIQRNQEWRDPIVLWEKNVVHRPDNKRAWKLYGKELIRVQRYEEGIKATERAATVTVDEMGEPVYHFDHESLLNLIVANVRLKRYEKAEKLIRHGMEADMKPLNRMKLYTNYGNLLRFQGKTGDAEMAYREALRLYPQAINVKINLANLLASSQRFEEAETLYQDVLSIEPNHAVAKEGLNQVQAIRGH